MQMVVYLFIYPFLWVISKLPFRVLYLLSDIIYGLIYYLIGYRKKTVRSNLALAFPDKTESERRVIEKKSYQHLCDMFLEMVKTLSITRKEIDERFTYSNLETFTDLEKKGKSIALMCAHYASYEWVISMNHYIAFPGYVVYKKIANKHFDKLVKKIRAKFQAYLITTKQVKDVISENETKQVKAAYGFAADQSPRTSKNRHWVTFMGVSVPAYTGAEFLAKKHDMNIIFLQVKKRKRGHYQATFEVLTENAREVPDYQITDAFFNRVEKLINEAPEYYLWTHKRWKHKDKN